MLGVSVHFVSVIIRNTNCTFKLEQSVATHQSTRHNVPHSSATQIQETQILTSTNLEALISDLCKSKLDLVFVNVVKYISSPITLSTT